MNAEVLVLSYSWTPLGRVPWQEAFTLLFGKRVEIISTYADKVVHSASQAWPIPSIIRFLTKTSAKYFERGVRFNRKNVWLRDKGLCCYCGNKVSLSNFTYDHVIPRAQGGKTTWDNIVVACLTCNQRKENKTPEQARMKLRSRPSQPKHVPGASKVFGLVWKSGQPEEWKDYISEAYWNEGLEE